jgi:hypothetical protein
VTDGLVLHVDAANPKSYPSGNTRNHAYSHWVCMVSGTATYSIVDANVSIYQVSNTNVTTTVVAGTNNPQRGTISVTEGFTYYGDGPVFLCVEDQHHCLVPKSLAGTQFWHWVSRNNPAMYHLYCDSNTTVYAYNVSTTGASGTYTDALSLIAGQKGIITKPDTAAIWFTSNTPFVMTANCSSSVDKTVVPPMDNIVYNRYLSVYKNLINGAGSFYTPGQTIGAVASVGAVNFDNNYPVMNFTAADGSGSDCTLGLGFNYLSDTYSWGNSLSDYVLVFPYDNTFVTVSYWNGSAWVVWDTHSFSGRPTEPAFTARDGTQGPGVIATNISGLAAFMASGATGPWKWEGNKPFYLGINDTADDEMSMLGWIKNWTDLSTTSNNGSLISGTSYSTLGGGSLYFNGANNYVSFTNKPTLSNQITIDLWVNLNNNHFTSANTGGTIVASELSYRILYSNTAVSLVVATTNNGWYTSGTTLDVTNDPTTGWKNIVCVYNSTNLLTYINGTLSGTSTPAISGSLVNSAFGYNIGYPIGAAGVGLLKGNVAINRIYNRALTASEVSQNFNAARGRFGI